MKSYEEIDENSNGTILKRAREDYAQRNNIKFGQKELAEYLGIGISSVGGWEQGRRAIPSEHFTRINNLLGTNFTANNKICDKDEFFFKSTLSFYFGMYQFTQRQYDFIIAKIITNYCKDILSKEEAKKYNQIINSIKKNNIFTETSKEHCNECYSYIRKFLKSCYTIKKAKTNKKVYISNITDKNLTETGFQKELYQLLNNLDLKKFIYEPYQNIPVYNSSGIIEFYENLPQKFNDNTYEYIFYKINNMKKQFPSKYKDGALALIRLGNFCFPNEDIIVQIGNTFKIEHINNKTDIESLKKDYAQWLIDDYKIIGAIVMIDYSTSSTTTLDHKITI